MALQAPPPLILPAHGYDAALMMLKLFYGARVADAWVAAVNDLKDNRQWLGGRLTALGSHLRATQTTHAHYFNATLIRPPAFGQRDRRLDANFEAGHFAFLDDVGVPGVNGAKLDKDLVDTLGPEPTCVVETSLGNYQYQYKLDPPVHDPALYRGLKVALKGSIWQGGIRDASGLIQYGRIASGINVKPEAGKHGFQTRLTALSGVSYTVEELARAFGVQLVPVQHAVEPWAGAVHDNTMSGREIRLIGRLLKNDHRFDSRDEYMRMCAMFKGASGGSADGLTAWLGWCAQQPQFPPEEPQTRWDTTTPRVGASELRLLLRQLEPQLAAKIAFHLAGPPSADIAPDGVDALADGLNTAKPKTTRQELLRNARAVRTSQRNLAPQAMPAAPTAETFEAALTILPGFDREEVTIVGGKSGAFKSLYGLLIATAVTSNRPDIVDAPLIERHGDVVVFSNEDSQTQVRMRLNALRQEHKVATPGYSVEVWSDQLFVRDPKTHKIEFNERAVERLIAHSETHEIAMAIVDTLAASVENATDETNPEFQLIAGLALDLARATGIALVLIHHVRKMATASSNNAPTEELSIDALRGGSTLPNSARNVLMVAKPSRAEEKRYDLSETQMEELTRVALVKRSHGPTGMVKWFRRVAHPVSLVDRTRPGWTGTTTAAALTLEPAPTTEQAKLTRLQGALTKIKEAIAKGVQVRVRDRGGASDPDSVQSVTGLDNAESAAIVSGLVEKGVVKVAEDLHARRRWLEVVDERDLVDSAVDSAEADPADDTPF